MLLYFPSKQTDCASDQTSSTSYTSTMLTVGHTWSLLVIRCSSIVWCGSPVTMKFCESATPFSLVLIFLWWLWFSRWWCQLILQCRSSLSVKGPTMFVFHFIHVIRQGLVVWYSLALLKIWQNRCFRSDNGIEKYFICLSFVWDSARAFDIYDIFFYYLRNAFGDFYFFLSALCLCLIWSICTWGLIVTSVLYSLFIIIIIFTFHYFVSIDYKGIKFCSWMKSLAFFVYL